MKMCIIFKIKIFCECPRVHWWPWTGRVAKLLFCFRPFVGSMTHCRHWVRLFLKKKKKLLWSLSYQEHRHGFPCKACQEVRLTVPIYCHSHSDTENVKWAATVPVPGLRSELCCWTVLKTWPRSMASLGFAFITSQVTINPLESTQQGQRRS